MSSGGDGEANLRAELVAHLRECGVLSDSRVAAVFERVPRHVFIPAVGLAEAYADKAVVTRYRDGVPASSASQPAIIAIMLEQLRLPLGGRVLEIGAGTGYNAALLSGLVGSSGRVVSVEIDAEVAGEARDHLSQADIGNVEVVCGDGALGWPDVTPYDGIIVTAGASDLAPAWYGQLAVHGRLVMPLSIRGVQQCVAFERADGHLRSAAVRECRFVPLAGRMANTDQRLPVPRHAGVYVQAAADIQIDAHLVAAALEDRGPATGTGVSASAREVSGSLRRWLAFYDPAAAWVSYIGPPEAAEASGIPPLPDFPIRGMAQRSGPCLLGSAGFVALELAVPPSAVAEPTPESVHELAVRAYGEADEEALRLARLITAWDAAGRPGTTRLRIEAYPSGVFVPDGEGSVHTARHTTFVVSML
jgi:protein-L-isoaspartate(D-aspartate) O-methyltransferase